MQRPEALRRDLVVKLAALHVFFQGDEKRRSAAVRSSIMQTHSAIDPGRCSLPSRSAAPEECAFLNLLIRGMYGSKNRLCGFRNVPA
jgi:hypothetical protein